MATTAGSAGPAAVFLDTNVLLAATDEGRSTHAGARAILERWPAEGTALYASGQILREYLVVATRPEPDNGLGLALPKALDNLAEFLGRLRFLDEDERVADRLRMLLREVPAAGKQVHDANLVATMLVHGVDTLVTADVSHFRRYGELLRILDLASVSPATG